MRKPNDEYDEKKRLSDERMAGIPAGAPDAHDVQPDSDDQIQQCLTVFIEELETMGAESIFQLTDIVVVKLKLRPTFSYGELAHAVADDDRFELAKRQLCCLAGGDPVKLYVKRLGF